MKGRNVCGTADQSYIVHHLKGKVSYLVEITWEQFLCCGCDNTFISQNNGTDNKNATLRHNSGVPGGSNGKESTCNAGDMGSVPVLGRFPGGGHGNPLQYSCLENPHGQRNLGYSPWGCKELDMTERLSTAQT